MSSAGPVFISSVFGRLDMIRKVLLCFQAGGLSLITTACLLH
jgi:hypothetical protein